MTSKALKKIIQEELRSIMLPEEESPEEQEAESYEGQNWDKPKVLSISRDVMSSSGAGFNGTLEDMHKADASELFSVPMSPEEVILYVDKLGVDIHEHLNVEDPNSITIDEVEDAIQEANIGSRDNTYNSGWWGPTMVSHVVGPASDEPYAEGVIIVSMHRGGDVRGNYSSAQAFKLESYAEEAPWYDTSLSFHIQTDQGNITVDAEDLEGYSLVVHEDETGNFDSEANVKASDIEGVLDFEDSEQYDLWS